MSLFNTWRGEIAEELNAARAAFATASAEVITATEAEFPVDGPPALTVLAEDAFQRARMQRRTKVRDHLKLNELAQSLASNSGLTPVTGLLY